MRQCTATSLALIIPAFLTSSAFGMAKTPPRAVEFQKVEDEFRLVRNGEEHFVKGAGGTRYMDKLVASGGNSIRAWVGSREALDEAEKRRLSVCFGLPLLKPRNGFDYTDPDLIEQQLDSIREKILSFREHPALLMWAIGNEPEFDASKEQRARVWKAINDIAKMIKQIDPNHPVITVTSGFSNDKFIELNTFCPDLDAVGINTYGKITMIPDEIKRQKWTRPYFLTEFGPRGWWEVGSTSWGMPIEGTSSEKAAFYGMGYRKVIANNKQCLGSYVFLWGDKQEKTHTWFNLFLPEGNPTAIVDAMSHAWTGQWPTNRAPAIGAEKMTVVSAKTGLSEGYIFKPNTKLLCTVDATDPNGDEMTIKWDIRREGATNKSVGGDYEPSIEPIEGLVLSADGKTATIKTPGEAGMYRIFVYAYDTAGSVGTANIPILVEL